MGAVHHQQAGSGPDEVLSTASRAEQATESSSTVEVEVTAVSPAKIAAQLEATAESSSTVEAEVTTGSPAEIAAQLEAAAESSSTGGGSSGITADVAEALSAEAAEAAEMQQAATEGDRIQQHNWRQQQRAAAQSSQR